MSGKSWVILFLTIAFLIIQGYLCCKEPVAGLAGVACFLGIGLIDRSIN